MSGSPTLCGFPSLPNELIRAIAGLCEPKALSALCQTSRQTHAICLGWIYRIITLDDPGKVVKCCQTLISRSHAAESVRDFQILCVPRLALKSFYRIVECAIKNLKNLQILKVSNSRTIFRLFCDMHFPRLSECSLPSSAAVVPFLKRNPTIVNLHVLACIEGLGAINGFNADTAFESTSLLEPIHMPNLQTFVGPANVGCSVIPQSQTSRMAIFWGASRIMSFSDGLAALSLSKVDVIELNNLICTWDCALLLSAIAEHMPRVERLQFRTLEDLGEKEDFFEVIENTLPSLPSLKSLDILEGFPAGSSDDHLDAEFATVRRWGDISPQLHSVVFPSNTVWGVICDAWLPGSAGVALVILYNIEMDASTMGHLKWFFKQRPQFIAGVQGFHAVQMALEDGGVLPDFVFKQADMSGSRISFLPDTSDPDLGF
ncbi:hypothetical protein B0H13DRAFT_2012111 [Mycena leptocephala]|nr:hypothetical protein B0H13DRAFT_2012111 [Mycena leptocephala]